MRSNPHRQRELDKSKQEEISEELKRSKKNNVRTGLILELT